jgi:hypothetical protein
MLMPRATVDATNTEHYDLKTCEGGFVELRRLSYGEKMKRQEMSFGAAMKVDRKQQQAQSAEMVMDMAQTAATEFEFKNCIIAHNLEDDSGNLLDFRSAVHVHMLDPRIGEEIATYIDQMNNASVDLGN